MAAPDRLKKKSLSLFNQKGGWWVVLQSVLMTAILFSGPFLNQGQPIQHQNLAAFSLLTTWSAVFGLWGVQSLKGQRTPYPAPSMHSKLITTGIYRFVRHPLYSSVLAGSLAWALLWSTSTGLWLTVLLAILLWRKSVYEEKALTKIHPAYVDYARKTKRIIPFLF